MQNNTPIPHWHVGDDIHGRTYGEWTADFWRWLTNFPLDTGPGRSDSCDTTQTNENVFFLAGVADNDEGIGDPNQVKRNCVNIDEKKSILIAILNKLSIPEGPNDIRSQQLLLDQSNKVINNALEYSALIDDEKLDVERVDFSFELKVVNPDNFNGQNNGTTTNAGSDGYWCFLKPKALTNGQHTIQIKGSGPDAGGNPFNTDVLYEITIS